MTPVPAAVALLERVNVPLLEVPAVAIACIKVFAGIPVPEIAWPTLKFVVVMLVRLAEFRVVLPVAVDTVRASAKTICICPAAFLAMENE